MYNSVNMVICLLFGCCCDHDRMHAPIIRVYDLVYYLKNNCPYIEYYNNEELNYI